MKTRTDAWALLNEYVTDQSLIRHMLAVEVAMRAYAARLGEDQEKWGLVGLMHDFDYQRWPDAPDHPLRGSEILRGQGYPEDVIYAILSHADYLADRYPRVRPIEKALYACDELAGLIHATARLRPGGIGDLTAASVKKKMKKKDFARNINRDDIERGATDFGVDLTEHIQFEIDAMKTIAGELGLLGGAGQEEGEA
jgi:putative nucleotidyltransferase with HDIG domain